MTTSLLFDLIALVFPPQDKPSNIVAVSRITTWKETVIGGLIVAVVALILDSVFGHIFAPMVAELPQYEVSDIPAIVRDEWPTLILFAFLWVVLILSAIGLWRRGSPGWSVIFIVLSLLSVFDFIADYYVNDYAVSKSLATYIFYVVAVVFAILFFVLRFGIAENSWTTVFALVIMTIVIGYFAMPQAVMDCTPWLRDGFTRFHCPGWYRAMW